LKNEVEWNGIPGTGLKVAPMKWSVNEVSRWKANGCILGGTARFVNDALVKTWRSYKDWGEGNLLNVGFGGIMCSYV